MLDTSGNDTGGNIMEDIGGCDVNCTDDGVLGICEMVGG